MKKNVLKKAFAAMAVTAVAATAFAASFTANGATPSVPPVKLALERKTVTVAEAQAGVTIAYTVSGADLKWSTSGIHIEYPASLTATLKKGDAVDDLELVSNKAYTADNNTNGYFITTASSSPAGLDGTIYTFTFKAPNAQPGDKYDIKFKFGKNGTTQDLFTQSAFTAASVAKVTFTGEDGVVYTTDPMTAAAVSNWEHGWIQIAGETGTTTTTTTATTTTTTATTSTTASTTSTTLSGTTTTGSGTTTTGSGTTTTAKGGTTTGASTATVTGVSGVTGVALAGAGLAATAVAAFVLRKKD